MVMSKKKHFGYDFKGANVKYYDNHVTEKMKNLKNI